MYNGFFNLKVNPFGETPDTKLFFKGLSHVAALDRLHPALSAGKGFILLTGPVGVGKTIISRILLKFLAPRLPTALILNPYLDRHELMSAIREEFGMAQPEPSSFKSEYDLLCKFLTETGAAGKRAILIVDEAQRLSEDALETIRLLSNLETDKRKLLQIILIGQPELEAKLKAFDLRQLDQRISVRIQLAPLAAEEVEFYVKHRVELAGGANFVRFDEAACRRIAKVSAGIPRLINSICDQCLVLAEKEQKRLIDSRIVSAAVDQPKRSSWSWLPRFRGAE